MFSDSKNIKSLLFAETNHLLPTQNKESTHRNEITPMKMFLLCKIATFLLVLTLFSWACISCLHTWVNLKLRLLIIEIYTDRHDFKTTGLIYCWSPLTGKPVPTPWVTDSNRSLKVSCGFWLTKMFADDPFLLIKKEAIFTDTLSLS